MGCIPILPVKRYGVTVMVTVTESLGMNEPLHYFRDTNSVKSRMETIKRQLTVVRRWD